MKRVHADAVGAVARWMRDHRFRMLIALAALVATAIEWAAIPPVYPLNGVFAGICVIGMLTSPFLPRTSGWLIIGTVIARLYVFDLSGPNPLWAAYLALAIIGYESRIPVAVAALLTISIAECIPVAMDSFTALSATWIGMVNYVGMFMFATMTGMALRWRKQRDESREQAMALERRQWELNALQRNTRLASRIHDSASGGLSCIALTAQRQLRRLDSDEEHAGQRKDWGFVNNQALGVLKEIHQVIDLMERSEPLAVPDAATNGPGLQQEKILQTIMQADDKLHGLGFRGTFEIHGGLEPDYSDDALSAATNLLGEIAANISRHLDPEDGEYYCAVTLGRSAIEIMQTNPIRTSRTTAAIAHGSGLALHRSILERLGGELNTSAEDGDWVIYAHIPTNPVRQTCNPPDYDAV
jgi:hypothetical protein